MRFLIQKNKMKEYTSYASRLSVKRYIFLFTLLCFVSFAQCRVFTGYAFNDSNKNGKMDKNEKGIAGILVSNQEQIVVTDEHGQYRIEEGKGSYLYVIKPEDYAFSCYLKNTPAYYVRTDVSNNQYNFGLKKQNIEERFSALFVGDPQMRAEKTIEAFKTDIVEEMLNYKVSFACFLGDIADNDLSIYGKEKGVVECLPYPAFHVFGNHDVNEKAPSAFSAADVFRTSFGPDYYSFNEGKVHFVVLNNILYQGWNSKENKRGRYFGGFSEVEFQWLKKDLEHIDKTKLVVIMSHIPFLEQYCYKKEIQRLFTLLGDRPHLLALSGHLHYIENYFFNNKTNWTSSYPFQNITIGAACGGWWTGPLDERGIPVSTAVDGSPNGYYKIDFDGNKYKYSFIPADHRLDFQMRITSSMEELYVGSLNESFLSINIFTATKDAVVKVLIDDLPAVLAENYKGHDLFYKNTYDSRYNYDNWRPDMQETEHLWKCILPEVMQTGYHRVKVEATDVDGNQYTGFKILEIKTKRQQ
jgi:hypothetical protein